MVEVAPVACLLMGEGRAEMEDGGPGLAIVAFLRHVLRNILFHIASLSTPGATLHATTQNTQTTQRTKKTQIPQIPKCTKK